MSSSNGSRSAFYFDNAATTPLDPRVFEEMLPYFQDSFGNPHSLHSFGRRAMAAVELARERFASAIGAEDPSQILFTSGATEANNQVLSGFYSAAVSPFEHSAVREPARHRSFSVLPNQGTTILPPAERVNLVSVMRVNNEIGSVWNPAQLGAYADFIHSDMSQALGKVALELENVHFATFSGHKIHGPKGVGALYFQSEPPSTFMFGGDQENGLRGGTLDVPEIVGMGLAASLAIEELDSATEHAETLKSVLLDELRGCTDVQINGGDQVSPFILSLSFLGLEGETLVIEMDRYGYAISSGAACSSRSNEPSHVLSALKIAREWSRGTVRISFGRFNQVEEARTLGKALREAVENLRRLS